ncbi:response regulator [Lysinibacillus sp. FSL M8-0216]|uniref:Two-component response regulator, SAPR family, consists of REC, wHTH and BTAD domains n=1 Tax=Lysinibacillus fusiformis TaxID=28031 RepID=A0A1H9PTZ4_9BACI|nr:MULTISPECIES: response regulator [Lysinibacillus]MCG7437305.1 response regulator [Lysinibacillus fusiformis]MED4667898.1 response regulator [Lysinibacillus fusiformis]NOG29584.1 response regulator [Lysinibacillus fusiformis]PCD83003.1 DNA-binding response regulator [Lysinibacillus fusiformis]QAS58263.1 DNA-binding response regulator [Lysinibacillus sphaericus]
MRIVLVDDEYLSITRLKTLLEESKVPGIEVVGEYTDSLKAMDEIQSIQPSVVFLDIVMPDMDGLALGEKIQELLPDVEIVFTTGFDQYALDAFNLHAVDYLLKPIQISRLEKTLDRLEQINNKHKKSSMNSTIINLFGGLHVVSPDGQTQILKWRTSKAKELFAYLLNHRDEIIYRDTILELFWPESDRDKASKQLYTAIYTIRQTLKNYGLEGVQISSPLLNSGYKLLLEQTVVDVEQWLSSLKALPSLEKSTVDQHEQVFQMYTGDYLGDCDYLWAESEKERLRRLWLHHAHQLSEFYITNENYSAAIKVQETVQALFAGEEENYFILMKLYDLLNNVAAVEEQYLLLKKALQEHLAVEPSEEIENWYKRWKQTNALTHMNV